MQKRVASSSAAVMPSANESFVFQLRIMLAVSLMALVMLGTGVVGAATSDQPIQSELNGIPFDGLVDTDGKALTNAAGIGDGQWTLVMIWATDCQICQEQKPVISAFHDAHKDSDAKVFGIALDGKSEMDAVKHYMDEYEVAFPTYVGDFMKVAGSYEQLTEENLRGTPTYLLFDPSGKLKGNNPGPISVDAIEGFIAKHTQ